MKPNEFDVIIIGGGITGAGTQRDCAMRGLRTLLIERSDIATGATGRNHGLLHSGARYAVNDAESAEECIRENMILRRIAAHCVEETDGLFITLPEDDLAYQETFIASCLKAGIRAERIDPAEARRLEPSVNPDLIGAVKVPDGSVDPFRLCAANMLDAKLHGGQVLLYTEVTGFIKEGDTIKGVRTYNHQTHEEGEYYAPVTVNACGIWGQKIAEMAGVKIGMFPAKGALLIFAHRVNNVVINRCRKPANADILVPGDTVCVIGTTSTRIPFEECDTVHVTPDEVDLLITEGAKLAPALNSTRILRAYAGVRPLVSADNDPSGRNISRGIVCLDHEERDGLKGFITITGGKLMTYRAPPSAGNSPSTASAKPRRPRSPAVRSHLIRKSPTRSGPLRQPSRRPLQAGSAPGPPASRTTTAMTAPLCANARKSPSAKSTPPSSAWMYRTSRTFAAAPAWAWAPARANFAPAAPPASWPKPMAASSGNGRT